MDNDADFSMSDGITEQSSDSASRDTISGEGSTGSASKFNFSGTLLDEPNAPDNSDNNNNTQDSGKPPVAPENYEPFNIPAEFDTSSQSYQQTMSEAQTLFKELNLTQQQAQKLVDLHTKSWIGGAAEMQERLLKDLQAQVDGWQEDTKRDPEFGGRNLDQSRIWVQRAIANLGGNELRKVLNDETGAIYHPKVWAAFAKIGRDFYHEDKFVRGANSAPAVDNSLNGMARRLYPDMYK